MQPPPGDTFGVRFLLIMIGLALFGCIIAGADYAGDFLPDEIVQNPHQTDMVALFYNKCVYICSLSFDLCKGNNPFKNPFKETICKSERDVCNSTCVQSHTPPL